MGTYELLIQAEFSAAHQLELAGGVMEPLHGHNWAVEVYIEGDQLDEQGLLLDFTVLRKRLHEVVGDLHDVCLNDHPAFAVQNPSTELVAKHIHDQLAATLSLGNCRISKVRIFETRDCAAAYIPPPSKTLGDRR